MKLTIERRDLFTVPSSYILCHCVSADFALGAGIAKKFAALGVRDELKEFLSFSHDLFGWHGKGYCIVTGTPKPHGALNLVTKEKYNHKPTLETLKQALEDVPKIGWLQTKKHGKIAMPKIGCGLDKLQWSDIERILHEVFDKTDLEILVCDWS